MLLILKIFGLQEIGALTTVATDVDAYSLFQQMASLHSNGSVYSSPPASPLSSHNESHYTNERNLFWIINLLRTLQMLSKGKMHRIMLLVQYKSSVSYLPFDSTPLTLVESPSRPSSKGFTKYHTLW